jgi:hypothetical protein
MRCCADLKWVVRVLSVYWGFRDKRLYVASLERETEACCCIFLVRERYDKRERKTASEGDKNRVSHLSFGFFKVF